MSKFWILLFTLLSVSCATAPRSELVAERPNSNPFIGLKGCFLLYNLRSGSFEKVMGETCSEQYPASSTFKVPLAAMAFDAKVLRDENSVLKWDGKRETREVLNRDHNAKTWMRDSVVWFSQRLTPQIGESRIKKYLEKFEYGNRDISAGLTQAWLLSPSEKPNGLRISAYEQIEFLKKLYTDRLLISERAMKLTREVLFIEQTTKGYRLSGKTGSNSYQGVGKTFLGWFVGHLEGGGQEYLFATNFSDLSPTTITDYPGQRARKITEQMLAEANLW